MARVKKPSKQYYSPSEGAMRRQQDALFDYDRKVKAVEAEWGVDRLPWLVDEALRGRFEAQMDRLNEAIDKMQDVEHQCEVTLRGVEAMVNAAIAAGHKPLTGEYWEAPMPSGKVLAVTRDEYEAGKVAADNRDPQHQGTTRLTQTSLPIQGHLGLFEPYPGLPAACYLRCQYHEGWMGNLTHLIWH